jgi:hypothetical protein
MEKTVRFAIIAFVGTIWVTFLYVPFAFSPAAEYRHLLPLLPEHMPMGAWQTFLTMGGFLRSRIYVGIAERGGRRKRL